jgi:uncharacterized membrane protein AbrB (regulator of aidB expression)
MWYSSGRMQSWLQTVDVSAAVVLIALLLCVYVPLTRSQLPAGVAFGSITTLVSLHIYYYCDHHPRCQSCTQESFLAFPVGKRVETLTNQYLLDGSTGNPLEEKS